MRNAQGHGSMKLIFAVVHDQDIEVRGVDVPDICAVQALDRSEDVLESSGPLSSDPLLAERGVSQRVAERRPALVEDLLTVGDEKETIALKLLAQSTGKRRERKLIGWRCRSTTLP